MIVYFDTSALLKRYLVEVGSPAIEALWNKTTRAVASEILYDEMAATFARKKREVPADTDSIERARATFRAEWLSMRRVAVIYLGSTWVGSCDPSQARAASRSSGAAFTADATIAAATALTLTLADTQPRPS